MNVRSTALIAALVLLGSFAASQTLAAKPDSSSTPAMQPVAILSLAGYDAAREDIAYLGSLSGNPAIADLLEGLMLTATRTESPLPGLNKSRPMGAAVLSDGFEVQTLGFLPVDDFDELLDSLEPVVGVPQDTGDGIWHLRRKGFSAYVREHNGWVYVAQLPEQLADLPRNPMKLLGGLHKKYDVALRVNVQDIPDFMRLMAIDRLRVEAAPLLLELERQAKIPAELGRLGRESRHEALVDLLEKTESITVGWRLDATAEAAAWEVTRVPLKSRQPETARKAGGDDAKRSVSTASVQLEDAVAAGRLSGPVSEKQARQVVRETQKARNEIVEYLQYEIGDAHATHLVTTVIDSVFEMVETQLQEGSCDLGVAVVGGDQPTFVIGGRVHEGRRLEAALRELDDALGGDPNFPEIHFNVAEHHGVKVHTLVTPTPPLPSAKIETAVYKTVGDLLYITLALGDDTAVLAIGPRGEEVVESLLTASPKGADDATPLELTLRLAPVLQHLAKNNPGDPVMLLVAETLQDQPEQGRVRLTNRSEKQEIVWSVQLDKGVLQALATYGSMQALRRMAGF